MGDLNVKRCTGCYLEWYCGKECFKSDWKRHQTICNVTKAKYKLVNLIHENESLWQQLLTNVICEELKDMKLQMSKETCQGVDVLKSHFIVKIQRPSENGAFDKNKLSTFDKKQDKVQCLVYNEDKSLHGWTKANDPLTYELVKIIKEKGVSGIKGYFYTIMEGKRIKINTVDIQPPEN